MLCILFLLGRTVDEHLHITPLDNITSETDYPLYDQNTLVLENDEVAS